ncbi:hypothetical protein BD779DRAFT_497504 [Infundibulicybe gibba]|nr:hypothetical protein BD779DRAFT_497504 [Infundibulicybe gibba]
MNVNAYFESEFLVFLFPSIPLARAPLLICIKTEDGYREDVCGLQDHALVKRTDGTLVIPYVEFGTITNIALPTLSSSPYKDWLHDMVFIGAGDEPLPSRSGSQSLSKEDFSSFYSGISRLGRACYQGWGPTKMKIGDVYIRSGAEAQPQVIAWIPTNQFKAPKAGKWQARACPELQQGVRFSDEYTRFIVPRCQRSASQVSFAASCFVSNCTAQSTLKTAWLSQAHHIFTQASAGQAWDDRACLAMCILVKITWEISFLQESVLPAPVTAADPEPSDIYVFIRDLEFDSSGAISDVPGTVWSYASSVDLGPETGGRASHPAGLEITQKMEFFVEGISWESQHYAVTKAAAEEYLHNTGVDIAHILDVPTVQVVDPVTLNT